MNKTYIAFFYVILFPICWCCNVTIGERVFSISKRVWKAADYTNNSNIKVYSLFFCNLTKNEVSLSTLFQETVGILSYPKSYGVQSSLSILNSEMIIENGDKCPLDESILLSARVKLVCGKYLGDLEFVNESNCVAYFEFSSNELCEKHVYKKQIPCYLINKYGYKINMLLLQNSGPHLASNSESEKLVFNVCADLHNTDCDVGASACYNKSNVGSISESTMLKLNDEENIELFYKNELNNCSTTIIFICPHTADSISNGSEFTKIPQKCSFKVRWYTEFACSIKYQIVENSCVLKTREFTFNLSPLNKTWIIEQKGKDNYTINLSVCQPKVQCNEDLASVCQKKENIQKVLGKTQTSLRYVDKKLYYIFKDGEKCNFWINRTTYIVLICDLSASDQGVGKPVFKYEDNCTYFIEWYTLFACPRDVSSRDVSSECRAINKDQIYDLTPLKKPINISNVDGHIIQISVCGLLNTCGNSSICNLNKTKSLGKFNSNLQILSDNSLLLNYTGGEKCNNLTHNTKILFICSPGNFLSTPNIGSVDDCHHLVTWETAYACPLIQKNGNQCAINDSRIDINLSYLKPLNRDFFNVTRNNFEFQMKICSGSKTTSCNENGNLNTSITGCYISNTQNTTVISTYQGSELLNYFAGMLDITYSTGQKCSNGDSYIMKISFICNLNISIGNPDFEQEVEHCFYHFTWITKFACIPLVPCAAFSDDGKVIELSRLQKMYFYEVDISNSINQTGKVMFNICKGVIGTKCSPLSGACYESDEMTMNLGFLKNRPQLLPSGDVVIEYENGDFCGSKNQSSTVIKIICNESAENPIIKLMSIKYCKYEFQFETTATCQNNNLKTTTSVTTSTTDTTPTTVTTSTTVTTPTTVTTSTTVFTSKTDTTTTTASVTKKLTTSRTGKIPLILAVTIVVAVLFIGCCWILYSPEKREMLTNTINSIMGRKTRVVSRYKYTKLSAITSDDDSDEINEVFSFKNESSDEEMLPL
nr:cation-independent mannose-6-phosphate receptor isoform X1 [Hydra vulgaris]